MKANKRARRDAKQLFRACLVNGRLDEDRARQVAQKIAAANQRGCLGTLSYFLQLVTIDRTRYSARVESAKALPAGLQASVQAGLERSHGPGLTTTFVENPALIGGMRVRVGSDVYDGSVQGRLAALEESF